MGKEITFEWPMLHRLLIYHADSKVYEEILSKRLPQLKIMRIGSGGNP